MIIDAHAHIMTGSYELHKREIMTACERYSIDRVYVSSIDGELFYPGKDDITGCNEALYKFMREQPGVIRGYVYVNPRNDDTMDVIRRGFEEHGVSGVKLWVSQTCDDEIVYPVAEACIERDAPMLVHAFHKAVGQLPHESTGVHVARLAERFPKLKIIMAHLGANCYDGIKAVMDYENVFTDMSGTLFRRDDLDYTIEKIGAGRLLFGTDMPAPGSYLSNLGRVLEANLDEQGRELVMWRNAENLFFK